MAIYGKVSAARKKKVEYFYFLRELLATTDSTGTRSYSIDLTITYLWPFDNNWRSWLKVTAPKYGLRVMTLSARGVLRRTLLVRLVGTEMDMYSFFDNAVRAKLVHEAEKYRSDWSLQP